MSEFKKYRKTALQAMRPYIPGEDMEEFSISFADSALETLQGGMIAINPDNPTDQWYIAKKFFEDNYELAPDLLQYMDIPTYNCHKQVKALQIKDIEMMDLGTDLVELSFFDGYLPIKVDDLFMEKHEPQVGGYFVVYKDGYQSYSPADVFEEGYTLAE